MIGDARIEGEDSPPPPTRPYNGRNDDPPTIPAEATAHVERLKPREVFPPLPPPRRAPYALAVVAALLLCALLWHAAATRSGREPTPPAAARRAPTPSSLGGGGGGGPPRVGAAPLAAVAPRGGGGDVARQHLEQLEKLAAQPSVVMLTALGMASLEMQAVPLVGTLRAGQGLARALVASKRASAAAGLGVRAVAAPRALRVAHAAAVARAPAASLAGQPTLSPLALVAAAPWLLLRAPKPVRGAAAAAAAPLVKSATGASVRLSERLVGKHVRVLMLNFDWRLPSGVTGVLHVRFRPLVAGLTALAALML